MRAALPRAFGWTRLGSGFRSRQQGPGLFQQTSTLGRGVEAKVPDLMEAIRKDMLDKAAQELDGVEGDGLLAPGAEGDMPRPTSISRELAIPTRWV